MGNRRYYLLFQCLRMRGRGVEVPKTLFYIKNIVEYVFFAFIYYPEYFEEWKIVCSHQ